MASSTYGRISECWQRPVVLVWVSPHCQWWQPQIKLDRAGMADRVLATQRPTAEQRATYTAMFASEGYCVVRGLFTAQDVQKISDAFDRLLSSGVSAVCADREHRESISQQLREQWNPNDSSGNSLNRSRANVMAASGASFALSPRCDLRPEQQQEAVANPRPELLATHLISQCGKQEPVLAALGSDPRLLTLAADVLDQQALATAGEHSLHQIINQAHFKAPGDGVDFPWHQDSINRGYHTGRFADVHGNRSYVNIAIAVDPETTENGPLSVYAGSHTRGHLRVSSTAARQGQFDWDFPRHAGLSEHRRVTPLLQPGDAIAFGMYVVHGSEANTHATQWRRAFINGFAWPSAVDPGSLQRQDESKLRRIPTVSATSKL